MISPDFLATQFGRSAKLLLANLDGLTHENSLWQPSPDVNCINWLVGHLISGRCRVAIILGVGPVWDESMRDYYKNGSPRMLADSEGIVRLERQVFDFKAICENVEAALRALPPNALDVPADDARFTTRGEHLAYMQFHEAHHAGQVMLLREQIGLASIWPF